MSVVRAHCRNRSTSSWPEHCRTTRSRTSGQLCGSGCSRIGPLSSCTASLRIAEIQKSSCQWVSVWHIVILYCIVKYNKPHRKDQQDCLRGRCLFSSHTPWHCIPLMELNMCTEQTQMASGEETHLVVFIHTDTL